MKKEYLVIANWKMYLPFNEAIEYATSNYDELVKLATKSKQKVVLCPSLESLYPLIEIFKSTPITIGAQNCSSHTNGSFTGQTSAKSLLELGCSHAIIGHSEARRECDETDEQVALKCEHLLDYDIIPITCVGETEQEYDNGETLNVLKKQLKPVCEALDGRIVHPYLTPYIAYEPIWSIGTGKIAPIDHLEMIFSWLHGQLATNCPTIQWGLIYGGSITPENIDNMKQIKEIDGFLVGKSSLDFQKFQKIVELL
jgi:triosephosphate isomerase